MCLTVWVGFTERDCIWNMTCSNSVIYNDHTAPYFEQIMQGHSRKDMYCKSKALYYRLYVLFYNQAGSALSNGTLAVSHINQSDLVVLPKSALTQCQMRSKLTAAAPSGSPSTTPARSASNS